MAVSIFYAALSSILFHQPFLHNALTWFAADSLGFLVTTPAIVAVLRSELRSAWEEQKDWTIVIPLITACILFLVQSRFPGPSLVFPLLVFILLRLGLGWASLVMLVTTAFAAWCTAHNIGAWAAAGANAASPGLRLQMFIVANMIVLYSVSAVVEHLRSTERHLQHMAQLYALVAENSRDVILMIDNEGHRSFISSPDHIWGGWTREDVVASDNFELVHPDDRTRVRAAIQELYTGKDGNLLEYRILRKDGVSVWVEASLRTVRSPISKLPTGILCNIREISERKYAEQQLEDAFHAVEALAVTDPLTGLANRRRFDQALSAEWRRARREQNPLSLLLIDVDFFKRYNDSYGHPSGDTCLRQIADAVRTGVSRPADLAARIGGEEFTVLLPNTSGEGARLVAHRICDNMRSRAIAHESNPSGIVTVSVGCATVVPQAGQNSAFLMDLADQALYSAKSAGRNCVYPPSSPHNDESFPESPPPGGEPS